MHLHPVDRDIESPSKRYQLPGGTRWATAGMTSDWNGSRPPPVVLDNVEVWRYEGPLVPHEPMYLVANLAVGGVLRRRAGLQQVSGIL